MAAKAAKLAQVGQLYFGGVGQFYIGANTIFKGKHPANAAFPGPWIVVWGVLERIGCRQLAERSSWTFHGSR